MTDATDPKFSDPKWINHKEIYKYIKYRNFRISEDIVLIEMRKHNKIHQKYMIDIMCERMAYTEYQNKLILTGCIMKKSWRKTQKI